MDERKTTWQVRQRESGYLHEDCVQPLQCGALIELLQGLYIPVSALHCVVTFILFAAVYEASLFPFVTAGSSGMSPVVDKRAGSERDDSTGRGNCSGLQTANHKKYIGEQRRNERSRRDEG